MSEERRRQMKGMINHWIKRLALAFLLLSSLPTIFVWSKEETVIETDLDESTVIAKPEPLPIKPDQSYGATNERLDYILFQGEEIVRINQNLKNLIEENEKLRQERKMLEDQLKDLRGQRQIEVTRLNAITEQRDNFQKRADTIVTQNQTYKRELVRLEGAVDQKQKESSTRVKDMEDLLALQEKEMEKMVSLAREGTLVGQGKKYKTSRPEDVAKMVDHFSKESEQLKRDAAKVHYNMGNNYFKRGEYQRAAKEYHRSLVLMPNDAEAHYNLALVSGEFLRDYAAALKHYRLYLVFNPDADDVLFVKEKMLEASLVVQAKIDSPLDDKKNYEIGR